MGGKKIKFCPECGTMLIPKEEGEKLICPDCGKEEKLQSKEDYKLQEEAGGKKAPGIAVVEEERKKKFKKPEYDIDTDVSPEFFEESY